MFKEIIVIILGLALAIKSIQGSADSRQFTTDNHDEQMLRAFRKLSDYVRANCERHYLSHVECLKAIKKTSWLWDGMATKFAARIVTDLDSFDECSKKAIWQMDDLLKAVPDANPDGSSYGTRLESILKRVMTKAARKCKSYVEQMFQERQRQLSNYTRDTLTNFIRPDAIRKKSLNQIFLDAASRDPQLIKQLADMNEAQFKHYYENYVAENVVTPCKDYLRTMSPVLDVADRFMIVQASRIGAYFDKPSKQFKYSMNLFKICKEYTRSQLNLIIEMPNKNN